MKKFIFVSFDMRSDAPMFVTLSDTSRVTLSDRAYWSDDRHGFSVRLAGNSDVQYERSAVPSGSPQTRHYRSWASRTL